MDNQKNIPTNELESLLNDLRNQSKAYLDCVKIVKEKYELGLYEACDLVINSQAFADQREDIIHRHQAAQEEIIEFLMERNLVKSTEVTMNPGQSIDKIEINHSQQHTGPPLCKA